MKMRTHKVPPIGTTALQRLNDGKPLRIGDLLNMDINVEGDAVTERYTIVEESWRGHPDSQHKGKQAIVLLIEEYKNTDE